MPDGADPLPLRAGRMMRDFRRGGPYCLYVSDYSTTWLTGCRLVGVVFLGTAHETTAYCKGGMGQRSASGV